jgi:hypothetical protein
MSSPDRPRAASADPPPQDGGSVTAAVAAVTVVAVAAVWTMLLAAAEPGADDGIMGNLVLFVLLPAAFAVIFFLMLGARSGGRASRGAVIWAFVVLPAGAVAAFTVDAFRDPEYYVPDGNVGLLILLIVCFYLLPPLIGLLVWFFLLWPISAVFGYIALRRSGAADLRPVFLLLPAVIFLSGVVAVVAAFAADLGGARAGVVTFALILFGLPGPYEIVWEPGVWILRVLMLAIVVMAVALRAARGRTASSARPKSGASPVSGRNGRRSS